MNLSKRYKVFLAISIFISVIVIGFSSLMLWVGMKEASPENVIKPTDQLGSAWPNSVFYEIFVRSFYDSDGDGIGDIRGMTEKLDYLKELGVEGIWLMPINPSPSYHGYDITDYYGINPDYGTMEDFKQFIKEAHDRNIKVIMDLVVNHTSKEHPWFKDALSSKDSKYRNWYLWADDKTNLSERGEWGQEVWHGAGDNKYYGVFWEGMPDLNFNNPEVRKEIEKVGKYWLTEIGVDGFRLDAAKHIYPDQEKEKNYAWWQEFRKEMQHAKQDVFLVGEVWAPATVVAPYLKDGLHSAFDFDLSSKIISSVQMEDDAGVVTYLERVRKYYQSQSKDYIDSTFLTNHDMDRVMSQLNGNVEHAKMAASILFTLPGTPFIYYGEEIGMQGKKPDEYIREPLQWYNAQEGNGQTNWERSFYNTGEDAPSVEAQLNDQNSLLNHYKTMIHLRRSYDVLIKGEVEEVNVSEKGIVAFKRSLNEDSMLMIHNISKEPKFLTLTGKEAEYKKALFMSDSSTKVKDKDHQVEIELPAYSSLILVK